MIRTLVAAAFALTLSAPAALAQAVKMGAPPTPVLQVWVDTCGAVGDVKRITNGAMSSGSTTLTSTGAGFTAADVGKLIYVNKADATGSGVLKSTIAAVNSSTSITLADANASGGAVSSATAFYGHDSTAAITACKAKADALGTAMVFSGGGFGSGAYLIRGGLTLTNSGILGQGASTNGNATQTYLVFAELGSSAALSTTTAGSKQPIRIENVFLTPVGWDATNGSNGYGMDIEARVLIRSVVVYSFAKSCAFAHENAAGSGGPYGSRIDTSYFELCGQHGFVVGTGANSMTLGRNDYKYNGAPSYTVAPSVAGSYDGLFVSDAGDGNPGSAYPTYNLQDLRIEGGDASYNSRYGWNFDIMRDSQVNPGYAELNLGDGTGSTPQQARIGTVSGSRVNFSVMNPAALLSADASSTTARTTSVSIGGSNQGSGYVSGGHPAGFDLILPNYGQQYLYFWQTTGDGSVVATLPPTESDANYANAAFRLQTFGANAAVALGVSPNAFVSGQQAGNAYAQIGQTSSAKLNFFGDAGNKRTQYGATIQTASGVRRDCVAGSLLDGLALYGIVSDTSTGTCFSPTQGSLVFAGASGAFAEDNANLFYDATNHRLGLGTAVPTHPVTFSSGQFAGSALGECWYNTSDQVTNYSRLCFDYESSAYTFKSQVGGSGVVRGLNFNLNGGGNNIVFSAGAPVGGVNSFTVTTGQSGMPFLNGGGTSTASSGSVSALAATITWNQSGSAAGNALLLNVTKTAEGSGEHDFIRAQLNAADVWVLGENGHEEVKGTAPTPSSCGTSPSVAGADGVGRITVGSAPSGGCTLTFAAAWTNAPICLAQDETTAVLLTAGTPSTTAVTFSGSIVAGDKIAYRCTGYR